MDQGQNLSLLLDPIIYLFIYSFNLILFYHFPSYPFIFLLYIYKINSLHADYCTIKRRNKKLYNRTWRYLKGFTEEKFIIVINQCGIDARDCKGRWETWSVRCFGMPKRNCIRVYTNNPHDDDDDHHTFYTFIYKYKQIQLHMCLNNVLKMMVCAFTSIYTTCWTTVPCFKCIYIYIHICIFSSSASVSRRKLGIFTSRRKLITRGLLTTQLVANNGRVEEHSHDHPRVACCSSFSIIIYRKNKKRNVFPMQPITRTSVCKKKKKLKKK